MNTDDRPPFEEDEQPATADDGSNGSGLVLSLSGYEGPIDVLLTLARDQKVDLIHISILELAEQYLVFVDEARKHFLELAADYLVMAAWLAYLKSKLLLPREEEEEPSADEMADALRYQLLRLQAMQEAGKKLWNYRGRGWRSSRAGNLKVFPFHIALSMTFPFTICCADMHALARKALRCPLISSQLICTPSMKRLTG